MPHVECPPFGDREARHTGAIPALDVHPLPLWLALGVRACINTDNTLLSATTAREEYARARRLPGMTEELYARAIACGHDAAFAARAMRYSSAR